MKSRFFLPYQKHGKRIHFFAMCTLVFFCGIAWYVPIIHAQIQSGYFVAPSASLSSESQQYLENKIRIAMSSAGAIPNDGYFPMVTILKYDEIEVIEISGMRTMFKSIGEVTMQVVMDAGSNGKATLLGSTSFALEGVGTSKQQAQMTAIRNIEIPEAALKTLYQRVSANYRQASEIHCSTLLQEAKKLLAQQNYQESLDAVMQITPTCANYKQAQQLAAQIGEEYSERRLRMAQAFFTQKNFSAAAAAASSVLSTSKSFAAAQKILSTITQRQDAQQRREESVIASDKAAERGLERLRIQTAGEIAKSESQTAANVARSRAAAEERYNAMWIRMLTK